MESLRKFQASPGQSSKLIFGKEAAAQDLKAKFRKEWWCPHTRAGDKRGARDIRAHSGLCARVEDAMLPE